MPIDKYYNIPVTFNRAEKIKLFDIAKNATANSPDATLLARANHTGVQAISTITNLQTTLDAKALKTTTINSYPLSSNITLAKADIGLGNVDNTSDANKPVSTAQQTALDGKLNVGTTTLADIKIAKLGSPTYVTAQHYASFALSPGVVSGGNITDAGGATVNIAAGTGFIRATDSDIAEIKSFDWAASNGISIPSNTVRYAGIEYNSGTPQVVIKTANTWDYDTDFPLGTIVNTGGTLSIANIPWIAVDNNTNLIERFDSLATITRDNRLQGLIVSETGTRNPTVTAGSLLSRVSEFPISAIDCSGAGTFTAYYRNGSGDWTAQTAQTQWNNTQYDDGSGTLATLPAGRYTNRWIYLSLDGTLSIVYGQSQSGSLATITAEAPPSTVLNKLAIQGILIGRYIIQKSASTATSIQSVFNTIFSPAAITNHDDTGNLQGGAAGEYYHLTAQEYTDLLALLYP